MTDYVELAVYGKRLTVGGIEMVEDEDGNLYSLENIEDKIRGMLPGGKLLKRIRPREKAVGKFEVESRDMLIKCEGESTLIVTKATPAPVLQPGTFLRPVLENPYAKNEA
jgi:hypothetical protein